MKRWLDLLSLSSNYERHARLLPALTALLPLLPLTIALGGSIASWGVVLGGTTGVFAIGGVALANLASAFGNRLQEQLWPDWPFDAPTNLRLMPDNSDTSPQQRARFYEQIKTTTGLDLQAEAENGNAETIRATVNDAVERVRNYLKRGKSRPRHEQESIRYGYARNLVGLKPVWLTLSFVSCGGTWVTFYLAGGDVVVAVISTSIPIALVFVAHVLPAFVRTRARYYCEVFFQLLEEEAQRLKPPRESGETN